MRIIALFGIPTLLAQDRAAVPTGDDEPELLRCLGLGDGDFRVGYVDALGMDAPCLAAEL